VRTTPVPDVRRIDEVLIEASLDEHRRISNLFSLGFYLRSIVLTPEGETTLNAQSSSMFGSGVHFMQHGSYSYAQTSAVDYRQMLRDSLERFKFLEENRVRPRPGSAMAGTATSMRP
jgi:hypothetical protein